MLIMRAARPSRAGAAWPSTGSSGGSRRRRRRPCRRPTRPSHPRPRPRRRARQVALGARAGGGKVDVSSLRERAARGRGRQRARPPTDVHRVDQVAESEPGEAVGVHVADRRPQAVLPRAVGREVVGVLPPVRLVLLGVGLAALVVRRRDQVVWVRLLEEGRRRWVLRLARHEDDADRRGADRRLRGAVNDGVAVRACAVVRWRRTDWGGGGRGRSDGRHRLRMLVVNGGDVRVVLGSGRHGAQAGRRQLRGRHGRRGKLSVDVVNPVVPLGALDANERLVDALASDEPRTRRRLQVCRRVDLAVLVWRLEREGMLQDARDVGADEGRRSLEECERHLERLLALERVATER